MRILYFQGLGGASGDMILGALASLGADLGGVEDALKSLPIPPVRLTAEPCRQYGLSGLRVRVEPSAPDPAGTARRYAEIRDMIERSPLPEDVKRAVLRVFRRIAEAEAHVHDVDLETVHFHEVGALDSIADIVGGCLGLRQFSPDAVCVAPLPLGRGTLESAHGTYPVPAPATMRLLKGFPVTPTTQDAELVTPTGAALLTTWHSMDHLPPSCRMEEEGYGFGQRELVGRPNALRAILFTAGDQPPGTECLVLECQVDDTTPELIGEVTAQLLRAGALDAYTTGVQMKKQRPGILITVLCDPAAKERLLDLLFRETTTLGVREHMTTRTMLDRRVVQVATPFGELRVKIGRWKDEDVTALPEFDDCAALAARHNVPVRRVYEAAFHAAAELRSRPADDRQVRVVRPQPSG